PHQSVLFRRRASLAALHEQQVTGGYTTQPTTRGDTRTTITAIVSARIGPSGSSCQQALQQWKRQQGSVVAKCTQGEHNARQDHTEPLPFRELLVRSGLFRHHRAPVSSVSASSD